MNAKKLIQTGLLNAMTENTRTTSEVQQLSKLYHNQFNSIAESVRKIKADSTRTHSEKAPLYKKVLAKIDNNLADTAALMVDNVENAKGKLQQDIETTLNSGDRMTRLHLATHLRDNKSNFQQLVNEDIRYLQASNEFPSSFYGVKDDDFKNVTKNALYRHRPELKEMTDTVSRSEAHLTRLIDYMNTLKTGTNLLLNNEALETRVDENNI